MSSITGPQSVNYAIASDANSIDITKFEQQLAAKFGSAAAEGVVRPDGTIDTAKLESLFKNESDGQREGGGQFDPKGFAQKFAKNFGESAGEEIQNADGSINFAKVKHFIENRLKPPVNARAAATSIPLSNSYDNAGSRPGETEQKLFGDQPRSPGNSLVNILAMGLLLLIG